MYFEEKPEEEKLVNSQVVIKKNHGLKVLFFLSLILLFVKIIMSLDSTQSNSSENTEIYKQHQEVIQESYKVQQEDTTEYETKYDIDLSAIEELKDQIEQ